MLGAYRAMAEWARNSLVCNSVDNFKDSLSKICDETTPGWEAARALVGLGQGKCRWQMSTTASPLWHSPPHSFQGARPTAAGKNKAQPGVEMLSDAGGPLHLLLSNGALHCFMPGKKGLIRDEEVNGELHLFFNSFYPSSGPG